MATKSDGIHGSCRWRCVCVCVWAGTWRSFTSIKEWVIRKLESHGMLLLKLISLCQGIDPESITLFERIRVRRGEMSKRNILQRTKGRMKATNQREMSWSDFSVVSDSIQVDYLVNVELKKKTIQLRGSSSWFRFTLTRRKRERVREREGERDTELNE